MLYVIPAKAGIQKKKQLNSRACPSPSFRHPPRTHSVIPESVFLRHPSHSYSLILAPVFLRHSRAFHTVIPAKAGIQKKDNWIPAFAGMTLKEVAGVT